MLELVQRFGISEQRREIICGLISYRRDLLRAGFTNGAQWLDGSFCEDVEMLQGRAPRDVDVITLAYRPAGSADDILFNNLIDERSDIFDPEETKERYKVDGYFIDLNTSADLVVRNTVYWYGLFSHQRETSLWKGMLKIDLNTPIDDAAAEMML